MYEKKEKSVSYGQFARTLRPKNFEPVNPVVTSVYVRETESHPSRNTPGGSTGIPVSKQDLVYTGNSVKGISLMHKSCFQPIFSNDEAKEHASMRR